MRKNIKKILYLLLINILIFPEISNAWNYVGHVVIAEVAYQHLTPTAKAKADKLSAIIFSQLPSSQQTKLYKQYPNSSLFAKIAMLPDTWKKWKLANIFSHFHADVPLNFILYSNMKTADWHFIDTPYPAISPNKNISTPNIIWALQKVKADFSSHQSAETNAMLMIFTEHLMGDINQPLHVMTKIGNNRESDHGGNGFCVKINKHNSCVINLHTIWDNAGGYLKPKKDIQSYAYTIQDKYPPEKFPQISTIPVSGIIIENYKYAAFVYSVSPESKLPPQYYRELQDISKEQLAKAGYELAKELNQDLGQLN